MAGLGALVRGRLHGSCHEAVDAITGAGATGLAGGGAAAWRFRVAGGGAGHVSEAVGCRREAHSAGGAGAAPGGGVAEWRRLYVATGTAIGPRNGAVCGGDCYGGCPMTTVV